MQAPWRVGINRNGNDSARRPACKKKLGMYLGIGHCRHRQTAEPAQKEGWKTHRKGRWQQG